MKSAILRVKPDMVFSLFISAIITLYFFYIDEGKYSFAGIFEIDSLFFLGVYVFILFGIQKLIQIRLGSLRLTRNISLMLQSVVSAIVLIKLLFTFFISFS